MTLPFTLDGGAGAAARIGLIVLQNDETMEPELAPLFSQQGIALYHSRIPSAPEVTAETLMTMKAELPVVARLLPAAHPLSVVGYGCTSGATIIGQSVVSDLIRQVHPDALTTDPITAVVAATTRLNVRRIGFITPYVAAVSSAMRELLQGHGLEIAAFASFAQAEEATVARIAQQSLLNAICALADGTPDMEAVFVSCTNLRSLGIIAEAERRIGKPVLSSNLVLGWHMLALAGAQAPDGSPGMLLQQ
ncbi:MAG: hypothetical protein P1U65_08290 [Minwuia sp.]|nr:hypothetical protein [Minwuia sp.]